MAQLEYLVAIVEHGSLRAAARELGLAQPALTRGVRLLEHELGAPLFVREAQGMVLTREGRLFHQRASTVVNHLRRTHEEIGQSLGSTQGRWWWAFRSCRTWACCRMRCRCSGAATPRCS